MKLPLRYRWRKWSSKKRKGFRLFLTIIIAIGILPFALDMYIKETGKQLPTITYNLVQFKGEGSTTPTVAVLPTRSSLNASINTLSSNKNLNVTQQNREELLKYGTTLVEHRGGDSYQEVLDGLVESGTPILLNNQLLSLYYKSQMDSVRSDAQNIASAKLLEIVKSSSVRLAIAKIISLFNKKEIGGLKSALDGCAQNLEQKEMSKCLETLGNLSSGEKEVLLAFSGDDIKEVDAINYIFGSGSFLTGSSGSGNLDNVFDAQGLSQNDRGVVQNISLGNNSVDVTFDKDIQIFVALDEELLDRMIVALEYVEDIFVPVGYKSSKVSQALNMLRLLKKYNNSLVTGKELEEILVAFDYRVALLKVLLTSLEVGDEQVLFATPFVGE